MQKVEKELKTEFIPEKYDKMMSQMFGEKYYEAEEKEKLDSLGDTLKILNDSKKKNHSDINSEDEEEDSQEEFEKEVAKPIK